MKKRDIQTIINASLDNLHDVKSSEFYRDIVTEEERRAYIKALNDAREIVKRAFNLEHQTTSTFDKLIPASPLDKLTELLRTIGKSIDDFRQIQVQGKHMPFDIFFECLSKVETMNELDETITLLNCKVLGEPITIYIDTDKKGNQYWTAKYIYNYDEQAPRDLHKKK